MSLIYASGRGAYCTMIPMPLAEFFQPSLELSPL